MGNNYNGEYAIEMKHITLSFARKIANDDVTLQLRKGEVHALLGENGAGKSTLMNVLFGLYKADSGEIYVNGKKAVLGQKIIPEIDKIEYNGNIIKLSNKKEYILLNKPIGYVTTAKEQFNRPYVLELIKTGQRVVPVGRLDMYTSGALILTNDGDFVYKVTHPKHEINKTYTVTIRGKVNEEDINKLKNGVKIDDDYITKPAKAKILKIDYEKDISRIEITIHEGKNRQVRKMCEAIGKKVLALHRSKIGNLGVKDLKIGEWRYMTDKEVSDILK